MAAAAVAGALATDPAPTGVAALDLVLTAGLAATVCLAAARARRWTWLLLGGTAAAVASGLPAVPLAVGGLALAVIAAVLDRPPPSVGAAAAALAIVALLADTNLDTQGISALVTGAAVAPVLWSGYQHARRVERRWARRGALAVGVALAIGLVGAALAAATARPALERALDQLRSALHTASTGDSDEAAVQLRDAARSFETADDRLSAWFALPGRAMPVLSQNLAAVENLAREAALLARSAAAGAADTDMEALRVRDGRVDLDALAALEGPLLVVLDALDDAAGRVDAIDDPWLAWPVDNRLDRFRDQLADARPDGQLALEAVRAGPELLGASGPRRYLALFTTPVEARGRYGFPGNFAELTLTSGQLEMSRFGRISELEQGLTETAVPRDQRNLDGPDDYLSRYARFAPAQTWRNITVSPDLGAIAQVAAQLYPQSGGAPIDGVMMIDPTALAELLVDAGPVAVAGLDEPVGPTNAAEFLLRGQYLELPDTPERVDALETIARTTFERLTTGALPSPRVLSQRFDPLVDAGHLAFTSLHTEEAGLLDRLGISGRVEPLAGADGLFVTSTNASASKIDLFLERTVRYEVEWDPASGEIAATAAVTLHNTAPPSGLPDYIIGNAVGETVPSGADLPPGTNRTFLTLYSPWRLEGARLDGGAVAMESLPELGRRAHSTFVTLAPGETAVLEVEMSGSVPPGAPYELLIEPSHLVQPDRVNVTITVEGDRDLSAHSFRLDGRVARASVVANRPWQLRLDAAA